MRVPGRAWGSSESAAPTAVGADPWQAPRTIGLDARLPETQLASVRAAAIGFVFQTFNVISTLSARENVEAGLVPGHLAGGKRRQRALAALDSVGLADRAHHLPSGLSGGSSSGSPSPARPGFR